MELESRIKAIEAKLRPIAQSEKEPAFSKTRYYLSSKYGLEESEDYCYECGMEKIGWVRWQIRLFLYATYDWASQHCFELRPNVYGLSVVRRRYCRNAIVVGLKLFLYLWGKADDKDWWYEGCWGENRPSATDGESDGMNFCESCGVGLDTWLTKAGAYAFQNSRHGIQIRHIFMNKKPTIQIPEVIHRALLLGASLSVSISGGKDSLAMLKVLTWIWKRHQYPGKIFAIFADLGRIEWWGAHEMCTQMARETGIPLVVVRRPQGGMIDRWEQRMEAIAGSVDPERPHWSSSTNRYCTDHLKVQQIDRQLRDIEPLGASPFWSSSANRYCTAELKRQQVDRDLRAHNLVICAVGIRAQESSSRAKNPRYCIRTNITTERLKDPPVVTSLKDKEQKSRAQEQWADLALDTWLELKESGDLPRDARLAFTWNAIFDLTLDEVWQLCGTSQEDVDRRTALYRQGEIEAAIADFPAQWVYVSGNGRFSCSQCVLASAGDVANGAVHNLSTWIELVEMELRSGWTFKNGFALFSLLPKVLEMSNADRFHLWQTLKSLGLVKPLSPQLALHFVPAMMWSQEAGSVMILLFGLIWQKRLFDQLSPQVLIGLLSASVVWIELVGSLSQE